MLLLKKKKNRQKPIQDPSFYFFNLPPCFAWRAKHIWRNHLKIIQFRTCWAFILPSSTYFYPFQNHVLHQWKLDGSWAWVQMWTSLHSWLKSSWLKWPKDPLYFGGQMKQRNSQSRLDKWWPQFFETTPWLGKVAVDPPTHPWTPLSSPPPPSHFEPSKGNTAACQPCLTRCVAAHNGRIPLGAVAAPTVWCRINKK